MATCWASANRGLRTSSSMRGGHAADGELRWRGRGSRGDRSSPCTYSSKRIEQSLVEVSRGLPRHGVPPGAQRIESSTPQGPAPARAALRHRAPCGENGCDSRAVPSRIRGLFRPLPASGTRGALNESTGNLGSGAAGRGAGAGGHQGRRLRTVHRRVGAAWACRCATASRSPSTRSTPRAGILGRKVVHGRARRRGQERARRRRSCRSCSTRSRWSRSSARSTPASPNASTRYPNEHKVPQIINVSAGAKVNELSTEFPENYVFRIAANDDVQSKMIVNEAIRTPRLHEARAALRRHQLRPERPREDGGGAARRWA